MILYVNWAEVLRVCPSDAVLQNLCSQSPDYLKGIFSISAFKRYFTQTPQMIPDLGVLISRFRKSNSVLDELNCVLEEFPVHHELFEFTGTDDFGVSTGIPLWFDRDKHKFYKSTKKLGYGLYYKDIEWIVVCNKVVKDPVCSPHVRYYFIIFPRAVFQLESTYLSAFEHDGVFSNETLIHA